MGTIYKNGKYYGGGVDIDEVLSNTSTNPVQNKVITQALKDKVPKQTGKDLSTNDFTNEFKTKLDNIEAQANKTTISNTLTSDSETEALSAKQGKILDEKIGNFSNPNLLSNPDFKINTRGKSEYTVSFYTETVNNWQSFNTDSKITVLNNGIRLSKPALSYSFYSFGQMIDNIKKGAYTFSAKIISNSGKFVIRLISKDESYVVEKEMFNILNNTTISYTFEIPYDINDLMVYMYGFNDTSQDIYTEIEWIKLELGNVSTPFIPPNHDEETLKCLGVSGTYSNPNLLINPDFKINQRGQSEYNENNEYTVDRWKLHVQGGTLKQLSNGGVNLKFNNDFWTGLTQVVENTQPNTTYTLSIKLKSISSSSKFRIRVIGIYGAGGDVEFYNTVYELQNDFQIIKLHFTTENDVNVKMLGIQVVKCDTDGGEIQIEWMKLELGSIATPFIPPNPAEELVKCQRYYYKLESPIDHSPNMEGLTNNAIQGNIPFPTTMRTSPSLTITKLRDNTLGSINILNPSIGYIWANNYGINCIRFNRDDIIASRYYGINFDADAEIY